jgi:hypothetical protein
MRENNKERAFRAHGIEEKCIYDIGAKAEKKTSLKM